MKQLATALTDGFRDIVGLLRSAPLIVALAFAAEFAQHIAEIMLGMFASRDAFAMLQGSQIRLGFGLVKVATLTVVAFWAARELAVIHRRNSPQLGGPIDGFRLAWTTVVSIAAVLVVLLAPIESRELRLALFVGVLIAGIPISRMGMDALFGCPRQSWRASLKGRASPAISDWVLVLPLMAGMALHFQNHTWAFGAAPGLVWALMVWDSLLVALLPLLMGVLILRSYRPPA